MRVLLLLFLVKQKKVVKKLLLVIFANNNIKGAPVAIDLVKSTYSIEEDATVISFNGRGL